MPLRRVHGAEERLDAPHHDQRVLEQSLGHVAAVNRWLGGRRALLLAISPFLRDDARVLDIGTGSGDLPRVVALAARRRGMRVRITATDLHPQMRAIAADASRAFDEITVASADALDLPYADDSFDIALLSLMLHHLDDEQAVRALREAARVAPVVIVNELHRTRLNYVGALLLSFTFWAVNPLTRHDGPLSVLRAYRAEELRRLAELAGLRVVELRRRLFQRLVLVARR